MVGHVGPVTEPVPPRIGKLVLSVAEPPGCLCETWAGAKPLHPCLPWWLPVLLCQRQGWCREASFQPWLPGDGGICACCPSCSESLPSSCQGLGRCWGQWVGEAALLLRGEKRGCTNQSPAAFLSTHRQVWEDEREEQAAASMRGLEVPARASRRLPFALGIPCVLLSLISTSLAPGLSPLRGF